MDFYHVNFAGFMLFNGCLAYREYREDTIQPTKDAEEPQASIPDQTSAQYFQRIFLVVYALVFGADWLQGPYIYTLYKDQKGLPEEIVAALFTTGFLAGAISALFVGSLADRYGRRTACLAFCVITTLSLISVLSDNVKVLFIGRALGGLSTTLMWTVFEAWMVTEYHQRNFQYSGLELSSIFGRMNTVSGVSAIVAGLVGFSLVEFTQTKTAPFMASAVCMGAAFTIMWKEWTENFGDSAASVGSLSSTLSNFQFVLQADRKVLTLALTSCCFEGSMYLFVFFWSPALIAAHNQFGLETVLPFGIIFSSFMGAMMLGSLLFTAATTTYAWVTSSQLLRLVCTVASMCLLGASYFKSEWMVFWSFCLYETCVGIYYPSMAHQKGKVIDDGVRANIYGMLRIPLNIFVVVALSLTKEGDAYRNSIFVVCSGLLLLVSAVLTRFLRD